MISRKLGDCSDRATGSECHRFPSSFGRTLGFICRSVSLCAREGCGMGGSLDLFDGPLSLGSFRDPQDAFAAFSKSLSQESNYLQRVIPHCGPALLAVEKAIADSVLSSPAVWMRSQSCPSGACASCQSSWQDWESSTRQRQRRLRTNCHATPPLIRSMPSPGGKNLIPGSTLSQFKRPARREGYFARGSRRHSLKRQCRFWATFRSAVCGGQRNFPPVPGCLPCPAQETLRFCLRKSFEMASP